MIRKQHKNSLFHCICIIKCIIMHKLLKLCKKEKKVVDIYGKSGMITKDEMKEESKGETGDGKEGPLQEKTEEKWIQRYMREGRMM